jgi:hypothetical protein
MAPLRGTGAVWRHLTQETPMPDILYLMLGSGGFALFAIAVRSLERM